MLQDYHPILVQHEEVQLFGSVDHILLGEDSLDPVFPLHLEDERYPGEPAVSRSALLSTRQPGRDRDQVAKRFA